MVKIYVSVIFIVVLLNDCCAYSSKIYKNYLKFDKLESAFDLYQKDCPSKNNLFILERLYQSDEPCWLGPYVRKRDLLDSLNGKQLIYDKNRVIISMGSDMILGNNDDLRSDHSKQKRREMYWYYRAGKKKSLYYLAHIYPRITLLYIVILILTIVLTVSHTKKGR